MTPCPSASKLAHTDRPAPLPAAFFAHCQEPDGQTATQLLTTGPQRWPHLAHLSAGELVIDPEGYVRVAIWSGSQASRNLNYERQAVLMATLPHGVFEIRCHALPMEILPGFAHLRAFRLTPLNVRDKRAPYADMVSGVRFRLHNAEDVHARWRKVRTLLMQAVIAAGL